MTEITFLEPNRSFNTAVLFLVFNRLETTKIVFETIRVVKPPRLYIASDGARVGVDGEIDKVLAVRKYILENIDWDCNVKTLYRDNNLGCKYAVSSAISWFFDQEEQGIILEDDCLPSQSFFWYCEKLLERFKDDLRIWHISGNNFQNGITRSDGSYFFSKFVHIWGWASWANRWKDYDVEIKSFNFFLEQNVMNNLIESGKEKKYWQKIFHDVSNGKIDTWDYQWTYTVWVNRGLSILPNKNLVSNIGFGPEATHTTILDSKLSELPREDLSFPLTHNLFFFENKDADKHTSTHIFSNSSLFIRFFFKLKSFFKKKIYNYSP